MSAVHVGRYELLDELGRGSMGVVYRARDPKLNRLVAIKTMSPDAADNDDLRRRLHQEAVASATLRHPNIVAVYDVGEQEGIPFITMELLRGVDLKQILRHRVSLSRAQKLEILSQVGAGMRHAHEQGIVHRDIKPANVAVLKDGTAKIMDFGIAHMAASDLTQAGTVLGSTDYMSPEQVQGQAVDWRSDVFSFGALAYEMVSFQRPFKANTMSTTMYNILHENPAPLDAQAAGVSPEFKALILECLEKDPERRSPDPGALVGRIEELQRAEALWDEPDAPSFGEIVARVNSLERSSPTGRRKDTRTPFSHASLPATRRTERRPPRSTVRRSLAVFALACLVTVGATAFYLAAPSPQVGKLVSARLASAEEHVAAHEYARAMEDYDSVLEISPDHAGALSGRTEAAQRLEEVIANRIETARSHIEAGRFDDGRSELSEVRRIAPDRAELDELEERILAGMSEASAARSQRATARQQLERGKELLQAKRYGEAQAAFDMVLRLEPDHAEATRWSGVARDEKERLGRAEAAYRNGRAAFAKRDYAAAVREYERSLQLDPAHDRARSDLQEARQEADRPRFGTVTVSALPFGEVYLDEQHVGTTPVRRENVPVGRHTVRVVREGFAEFVKDFQLEEGQTTNVVAQLQSN